MARSAIAATALASVACIATCAAAALAAPTAVSAPWIMSTVPPVPPDLDCTVRGLAYDYARHLMPAQGSFQSVYDALQLGPLGCNVSLAEPASRGDSSDTMASSTVLPSSQVFADPVHGNDANDGSITSPVRTLGAAVSRARAMPPPATVNLRSGTFYLHETVVLDAAHDSQLTIAAYNGEAVEVSGGVPITGLQWKPYNVTAKANTTVVQGLNNIDGQCGPGGNNSTIWAVGTTPDARGCAAKCDARSDCTSFTWHDGTNPDPWKLTCFLRTDGVWDPTPQAAHWSGFKAPAQNVWVADIAEHMERHYVGAGVDDRDEFTGSIGTGPDGAVKAFTGLRVNGQRGIRARYPNGDPETVMYPQGYTGESSTQWHKPVVRPTKATNVVIDSPNRTQMMTGYLSNWQVGVGGNCEGFWDPPASYWCMSDPPRGATYTARVPSGLTWANGTFGGRTWPNWRANESMLMAFRNGHWFSYGFLIDSYSPESRSLGWSYGGFQGAEGADNAGAWAVENVFDELDAPREWFVDAPTGKLYYFANTTAGTPPSADTLFVSTRLKTLLAVNGTQEAPVMGVTLRGITFTTAASTLLDPHGVPSDGAGDWALSRSAAVFIQGSLNTTVQGCTFERVDGNALMLSGFNREAWIVGNTFHWIGENAMVSWGNSRDVAGAPPGRLPFGMGMDGTGGDQPRGTHVVGNLCHEIGSFQKQVSCWFQAKTALTTLDGNVFFNGPRLMPSPVVFTTWQAGINFNDGFGGGNLITNSLVFNMVRETADHGCVNTWDRQPFLTDVRDGTPSLLPVVNEITQVFMINNYNPQEAIDNDDGSFAYHTSNSFFPFSVNGLKNDFGGGFNIHTGNMYIQLSGGCLGDGTTQVAGYNDHFVNNTCVMTDSGSYALFANNTPAALPIVDNNTVYTPDGTVQENGQDLAAYQKATGRDLGTTVHRSAELTNADIAAWAHRTLEF